MKKIITLTIIGTIIFCIGLLAIPKHETPTDPEWEAYLKWEEQFLCYRNSPELLDTIEYQIQNRDTYEVYYHGTLQDCKDNIIQYELTKGECVVLPCVPIE